MTRVTRRLIVCALLLGALPAQAGPAEDYIAARNAAAATVEAAVKAGKSEAQIDKIEQAARTDLERRMTALLGPLRFKGLETKPTYSPDTFYPNDLGADSPDGLVFTDKSGATFVLVSPEPVFADWLKARAADEGAPAAFKEGIKAAVGDDVFFTLTISRDAAFSSYARLPLAAAAGEEAYGVLGLFAQDVSGDAPPDSVLVVRVADGRVMIGSAEARLQVPAMPACAAAWKDGAAKAEALIEAAQKSGKEDDPRMEEGFKAQEDAAAAFRTCFAREAAGKPVLGEATKMAEGLLGIMRGR
ncbi:hypothetical protein ABLE93_13605 [Xanthobacter sp. KR7-65]|uniref:hypothetical protein n=1 Tax=Xanthobacter sp. KR7-65 TaxID=3156612 RepID=UPI0032B39057